jgi:hypothetical protein
VPGLDIEKELQDALCQQLGASDGDRLWRRYAHAKHKLFEDVLPNIKGVEPNLTDHGGRHIENVLSNAHRLVQDEQISALDLYLLCQSILFHDAGNVGGRKDHQKRVGEA